MAQLFSYWSIWLTVLVLISDLRGFNIEGLTKQGILWVKSLQMNDNKLCNHAILLERCSSPRLSAEVLSCYVVNAFLRCACDCLVPDSFLVGGADGRFGEDEAGAWRHKAATLHHAELPRREGNPPEQHETGAAKTARRDSRNEVSSCVVCSVRCCCSVVGGPRVTTDPFQWLW